MKQKTEKEICSRVKITTFKITSARTAWMDLWLVDWAAMPYSDMDTALLASPFFYICSPVAHINLINFLLRERTRLIYILARRAYRRNYWNMKGSLHSHCAPLFYNILCKLSGPTTIVMIKKLKDERHIEWRKIKTKMWGNLLFGRQHISRYPFVDHT